MASRVRNLVTLRKNNKNNILWLLYNKGPMSRLTLATTCGLTGAAMTVLIKEMLAEETVIETERIQRNQTGRREVLLDINYNKFFAIGINIEEDYTYLSIGKLNQLQDIESFLTDDLKPDILESLITKLEGLLEKYQTKTIIGIGVGVVGLVDENSGIVLNSYGLFPENYQLKALLARRFSYPIYLSNNVRSQAKALINDESTDFLFIKHGPGVGASLVINGEVVEGFYNRAGELGHTVVDINGELCKCGKRGCLEVFLREKNIRQKYAKLSGKTVN
ncbi:MAG: ROK family transcriptional regulator, partial [Bacilli bacterium]|nr:ROK family transcriptional regulator [Bacilli bacterium]